VHCLPILGLARSGATDRGTFSWTTRATERQMAVFNENARRYVDGLPLVNVDKRRGY